jgi:hypothetical protein
MLAKPLLYFMCTDMQRAKGKPLLRVVVGAAGYMFEFASEADRESLVDAYTKVCQGLGVQLHRLLHC